jgi:hypothetical protein
VRRFSSRHLFWVVPLLIAACSTTVWLLSLGAKGAGIADTLSFFVGVLALIAAILAFLSRSTPIPAVDRPMSAGLKLLLLAEGTMLLGAGVALSYWLVVVKPDLQLTGQVAVANGRGLVDGAQASITLPGEPPERRYLSLTPTLVNPRTVGDCVAAAELDITLVVDGKLQDPSPGHRSNRELRLDLDGVSRDAKVLFTVHMPDPGCGVDLDLSEAVLFN